jgi:hypothetical protein
MAEISATYPAGKYYIGDVCYALDKKVYHNQWGKTYNYKPGTYVLSFNGNQQALTLAHTKYGDGVFVDDINKDVYNVDSGLIGIVPWDLCSPKNIKNNQIKGGHFIESITPIEFKSQDGIFVIGYNDNRNMIIIDTQCEDDDNEEN